MQYTLPKNRRFRINRSISLEKLAESKKMYYLCSRFANVYYCAQAIAHNCFDPAAGYDASVGAGAAEKKRSVSLDAYL
ncbi:MAG: hypothetical protein KBS77_00495 [Bacteroidales bacterium]|nr:hypothetical protein [Candidatus Colicola faecequi]